MCNRRTFLRDCLSGLVDLEGIDDYIDAWHAKESDLELHEFLGFTWDEYRLWVEQPEALPFILMSRRFGIPLETALRPSDGVAAAARVGDPEEAAVVIKWLKKTGRL